MINNGIKYSHGLQAQGNRGAFLCGLKTKKSLTAGPISLSQGFTLFGITRCLLHEYAFCPYQVDTKRQYRGVAGAWWLPLLHSGWETFYLIRDISGSAFVAEVSVSDDKSRLFSAAAEGAVEWVSRRVQRFLSDIRRWFYNIKVTFAEAARLSGHCEAINKALYSKNHNTGSHICVALLIL